MTMKFLYSLFCLLKGVLSAMSSRAAGPGVITLLPSDYRAANKNRAVAEDDAGTLYAGIDKGLLEFDGLHWRLYELPRASIVRSVAPLSHDVIFTGGFEEFGRWDRAASGALRYTSLVPAQRNPRFSDSEFWKIYITPQGVLFQSFHGIYLYDYERVRRLTGEMNMLFLLRAGDEFWVQEMGGPLYRMRQESVERLPDSDRFSTTTVRVLLPDTVVADLRDNSAYWAAFEGPVNDAAQKVYDSFLKSSGDPRGTQSYGTVVDMLMAYYG